MGTKVRHTMDALQRARDAYTRRDWSTALAAYRSVLDEGGAIDPEDRYAVANCSWWLGDVEVALPGLEDAYQAFRATGQFGRAAMAALDIGYTRLLRGEQAPGLGWVARAYEDAAHVPDGVEHGYLAHVGFEDVFGRGDLDAADEAIERVRQHAERSGDPTLRALALTGAGRVLVRRARVDEGVAVLDQAMIAAVSDVLDPGWAGNIYCHLMAACIEVSDVRRAAEWTEETARWCQSMPGAGPFLGVCRVHRAQILQLRGQWAEAEREVLTVCEELRHFAVETVAEAYCLHGGLCRLRGDLAGAGEAYAAARALGREPVPGVALLALARGDPANAVSTLHRALSADAPGDAPGRARLLPALVEAALAAGDIATADAASSELERLAERFGTVGLDSAAATARARVLLRVGRRDDAQRMAERAVRGWSALDAPYEVARALQLCAEAREVAGDRERARLERQAARAALRRLGVPDAEAMEGAALTAREREVLALVAQGRSNQDVADTLVLSVRTVERHLESIYRKLGVSGRSARVAAARSVVASSQHA
jgi:DNA-binding NarL/FixJ family response regulator